MGPRRWRRLGALARAVVSLFVSAWFVATALAQAPPAVGDPAAPPTVTSHPDIGIVAEPLGNTSFTATADGSPAPTVQWQVSSDRRGPWVDIPGATATTLFVTASEQPGDVFALGNAFRAVFTNHAGTAISRPAKLVWRAQWMRDLGRDIAFVPLTELTIPGAHDMGTYGITGSSADSTDGQALLCGVVHTVCERYGRAQDPVEDAEHQLNGGIRYFDLRVCGSGGDFVTCHGLEAARLQEILDQTRAWIDSHPGEVVFLDFNHHYLLDPDAEANLIEQAFALPDGGSLLIPPQYCTPGDPDSGTCANNLTLQGIAQRQLGRVVVNFQNDNALNSLVISGCLPNPTPNCAFFRQPIFGLDFYDRHPLFWGRRPIPPTPTLLCTHGSAVTSCFGNDAEVSVVLPRVLDTLTNNFPDTHFFVQFLQTTPDGGFIFNHLGGGLLDMAFVSNPVIGPAVFACSPGNCFGQFRPENLNILAINYYNRINYRVYHLLTPSEIEACVDGLSTCPLTPERLATLSCALICTYYDPVRFDFVEEVIRFNAYARTAPVIEVTTTTPPASTGWHNAATLGGQGLAARVDVLATDYRYPTGISALDCLDNTTFVQLSPGTNAPFARGSLLLHDGTHALDCRATDGARFGFHLEGNRGAGPGSTPAPLFVNVDTTPPAIACAASVPLLLRQPAASIAGVVTDATSGPSAATVSAAADTQAVGSFVAPLSASDNAGNSASATCGYTVSYGVGAQYDAERIKKAGSTVPIRIQLQDYFGTPISNESVRVTAVSVTNANTGAILVPTSPGATQPGFVFSTAGASSYTYQLKTTGYSAGAYTLDFVVVGDPLIHHAPFELH
jgi:hypothetical protein